MNAERLHAIAKSLASDLTGTKTIQTITGLRDALQNQVNQPQQPQHQQAVAQQLRTLETALEASATNEYSPAWAQALEELGAFDLTGMRLRDRIQEIFARNQITPSVALDEINELHKGLTNLKNHADQVISGLAGLGVGTETLGPGEAELGLLIPRSAVDNELGDLARELQRLDRTFGVFAELATGSQEGFQIRAISSSDLSVYVAALPQVAACAAVAVERVVTLYKKLLEIRRLRKDLADQGVPEEKLSGIEAYADQHMKSGLKPVVDELVKEYYTQNDKARRNELRKYLESSLNEIANRIDRGYHVEIRVEPMPESDEEGDGAEQVRKYIETIVWAQPGLQFFRTGGAPILQLPESTEAGKEEGD